MRNEGLPDVSDWPRSTALPDELDALRAEEAAALRRRRAEVLGAAATSVNAAELELPTVGLALSGGGVRSATFALGLMRGLARPQQAGAESAHAADDAHRTLSSAGLLGRLDYLSTVSGGGYTGALYGRLAATYGSARAQALMARGDSPVLGWLRRNGRYLTPSGSRDIGIAVVTYLRAWVAIHLEFMFACILLGLVVIGPHLANHRLQLLDADGWARWQTPWWPVALAFWLALAPGLVAGYWAARDSTRPAARDRWPGWRDALFLLVAVLLAAAFTASAAPQPLAHGLDAAGAGVLTLWSLALGQLGVLLAMALHSESHSLKVAQLRNRLTRALRVVMLCTLALAGLGALDRLSWWVLQALQSDNLWLWSGVGAGGIVLIALRTLMQPLQQIATQADRRARDWLPRLIDCGSLFGLLVLITSWLVAMQWFVFSPDTLRALADVPPLLRAALLAAVWIAWTSMTAGNAQMANTSSLHTFYRARLARAYLAAGNPKRAMDSEGSDGGVQADVTRVLDGDDTRMDNYRPESKGGPIHLVNTCLNQTRDDQSGLYNADRKGTAVTATWRGLEIGPAEFIAFQPGMDAGTLGRWVAVSGAAASPGAGSYTSRGIALLVYFLGVRLGYWMRAPREHAPLRWLSRLGWRLLPKPLMLASEASATFFGRDRPWWYLSDGGHFENSAVYPLLKREVGFILLSDAGSDARYEFNDLENLVRKARIDFGAEIDFYTADEAKALFCLGSNELTVLSPEDMVNNHSCRGVLLARIRYRERRDVAGRAYRPEGTLLVVKPNLHDALDVDLLGYARKHEAFPHEPTSDQSFDEAQWESYHRLGEDFGRALHESWLAQVPGWRRPAHHAIRIAARLGSAQAIADGVRNEPLWRRSARATAIGTTLGVSVSGTLLLSLWQMQEQFSRSRSEEQVQGRQLFTEVSKGMDTFRGACPQVPEHVLTQASMLLPLRDSTRFSKLEQEGLDRLFTRIDDECRVPVETSEGCNAARKRVGEGLCAQVSAELGPQAENRPSAMSYWRPLPAPAVQAEKGQLALFRVASLLPIVGARFAGEMKARQVEYDNYNAAWGGVAATYAQPAATTSAAAASPAQPARPGAAAAPAPAETATASAASASAAALTACARGTGSTTLYIHIYDEGSRAPANALRRALQSDKDAPLIVAPIENVTRSADLRQRQRPSPWPRPTVLLHEKASRNCALAIARYIGSPWLSSKSPGDSDRSSVVELPASLKPRSGVIELWLPPVEFAVSRNSLANNRIVGAADAAR
jgi:hypothetical protein